MKCWRVMSISAEVSSEAFQEMRENVAEVWLRGVAGSWQVVFRLHQ